MSGDVGDYSDTAENLFLKTKEEKKRKKEREKEKKKKKKTELDTQRGAKRLVSRACVSMCVFSVCLGTFVIS